MGWQGGERFSPNADTVVIDPIPLTTNAALLIFSATAITDTGPADDYLLPGGQNVMAFAMEELTQIFAPRAGVMRNLTVRHNSVGSSSNPIIYTLRVNSLSTPLTVQLNADEPFGFNFVDQVVVNQGDTISIRTDHTANITSPKNIYVTLAYF